MLRNRSIVLSVLLVVLALGTIGGSVLAQTTGDKTVAKAPKKDDFVGRLAVKLGISEPVLQEAWTAVKGEQRAERRTARITALRTRLDVAVQGGVMTAAAADAYFDWHIAEPDMPRDMKRRLKRRSRDSDLRIRLDAMVSAGLVTSAQADAYHQWRLGRPELTREARAEIMPNKKSRRGWHKRGHHRKGKWRGKRA